MIPLLYALTTSVAALVGGALPIYTRLRLVEQRFMVAFASAAMVAVALFDLIREIEAHNALALLLGFFSIYPLEKLVTPTLALRAKRGASVIHACRETECEAHAMGWPALIGIAAESLIDGLAIAVGFRVAPALGLGIMLAVFAHEVPRGLTTTVFMQEACYSRLKIWAAHLVDAGFAPLGVLLSGLVSPSAFEPLIGFTRGVFLYVGASDLLLEAHRRFNLRVVLSTLAGGGLVPALGAVLGQ